MYMYFFCREGECVCGVGGGGRGAIKIDPMHFFKQMKTTAKTLTGQES